MTEIERNAVLEEIQNVKDWIREIERRAEKINSEPALPSVGKEWSDKNFWEFLTIANKAKLISESSYWITARLYEMGEEK